MTEEAMVKEVLLRRVEKDQGRLVVSWRMSGELLQGVRLAAAAK